MKNNTEMTTEGYDNYSIQALELKAAEESIDLKSDTIIREEYLYQKKQERFKKTAFGVQTIVSRKLYRAANLTVEEYFRKKWNISRAQVYRFLDAADVLRQLKDFTFTPRHELLCRTLKHYAKTSEHMVILWQAVLDKAKDKLTSINSGLITKVWNELVASGKIVPIVPEKGVRRVRIYKKKTTLPIPSYSSSNLITSSALTEIENSIKNINNISENSIRKINSRRNHDSSSTTKVHREKESKLFSRRINKSIAADLEFSESLLKPNNSLLFNTSQPNTANGSGNSGGNPQSNYNNNNNNNNFSNIKMEPPTPPPEYIYNNRNTWNCQSLNNNFNNNNNSNGNMNYNTTTTTTTTTTTNNNNNNNNSNCNMNCNSNNNNNNNNKQQ
ncbi:hypothetical protein BCR36DRAFT_30547 [Piromyces finnis]|uniref:Uncharacterized protein n=1 Tax=Piromyces finnis TaxID=1754191 RepID=A0A1Y1VC93_9FUNG|nr:hypothetical protein BCR36DRAFT_30547 [Piromyces finnis]|eukprot:ORX52515.1 hypothetical protein BCR36DRAFT_30547 [Piromyces finnis]